MPIYKDKNAINKPYYIKYKKKTYRGFKTKADASNFEAQLKIMREDNSPLLMNFETLCNNYLAYCENNLAYSSFEKFNNIIRNIIMPNVENKIINDIKEYDCLNFRMYVNKLDYSTTYKNDILGRYKSIFIFANKYYGLTKNPSQVIEKFKKTHEENIEDIEKPINVWNNEEFEKFILCVNKYSYQVFFTTLYYTGMRLGECLALTWKDYDNGILKVRNNLTRKTKHQPYEIKAPKTIASYRDIPLNKSLISVLDAYKMQEQSIPGFSNDWFIFARLKPFAQTTIDRIKEKAIKESGVKRIRIHDLRHSHATNLINDDINIVAVSHRLGHSTITQTLNTYTHLMKKSDDALLQDLEKCSQNVLNKLIKQ